MGTRCASAETPFWPKWTTTGLPGSNAIAQSSASPDVILALRMNADPVRSLDGGATFSTFTVLGIQPQAIISTSASNVFYATSAQPQFFVTAPPDLYRSDDSGATWGKVASMSIGAGTSWIGNIVAGESPDVLYGTRMEEDTCFSVGLCTYAGAEPFRSIDGGKTWQSIGSEIIGYEMIVRPAVSSNGTVLYATRGDGSIFRTKNSGASWDLVNQVASLNLGRIAEIAVDQHDPSTAYVRVGGYPNNGSTLLVTADAGTTWRTVTTIDAFDVGNSATHLLTDPLQAGRVYYVGDQGHVFSSNDRGDTWTRVAGLSGMLGQSALSISADGDRRFILASDAASVRRVEIHPDSYVLGSDLWWNPQQPGWGITITQHPNGKVFVAWYAYDTQGRQVWRVIPEGTWQDAKTLAGAIYETRGPAYFEGAFDPAHVSSAVVGFATLAFDSGNAASFTYRLDEGTEATIPIVRELYGVPLGYRVGSFGDLWWNPSESGWGVAVNQHYNKVFATWYVYDSAGHPQWLVLPDSTSSLNADGTSFSGAIYVTSAPPSMGAFDPHGVTVTQVGTATLAFPDPGTGTLTYTAFGQTATRPIVRQPF